MHAGRAGVDLVLIDEVSLATLQASLVQQARKRCQPVQRAILQGELKLEW